MVRSSPSAYSSSKQNRPTGTSWTAWSIPYLRRRSMTSPNGRSSAAAASYATTSPSTIASAGASPAPSSSTTSGNWSEISSSRRVNSSILPSAVRCAWTRTPSYLYSAAHSPAQAGQDLPGVGQPLRQHDPHRVARLDPQPLHRGQAAAVQGGRDLAEVAADVVTALEHRPGGLAARVHLGERVQDGGRADAEPQVLGDQPQQVPGLQRGGPAEQSGQQLQLAALRTRRPRRRRSPAACAPPRRPPGCRSAAAPAASSRSAAWPRSPVSRTRAATCAASVPAAAATARTASFSARPRSTPANSGAISPWHR